MYADITNDPLAQQLLASIAQANQKIGNTVPRFFSHSKQTPKAIVDISKVERAISFAKYFHEGQFRKSGEPYITHPIAVAHILLRYCFTTSAICGALLHDVIEDTCCTYEQIASEFGDRTAEIVHRLTRIRDGKKITIAEWVQEANINKDKEVNQIKICDRIHNIYTVEHMSKEKQIKIANETLDYFLILCENTKNIIAETDLYYKCLDLLNIKLVFTDEDSNLLQPLAF